MDTSLVFLMVDRKEEYLVDHSVEKLGHLLVVLWEFQSADQLVHLWADLKDSLSEYRHESTCFNVL